MLELIKTYAYLYTNLREHILEASKSQSESLRVTRVDSHVERQYLTRVTADIVQCPGVTLSVTEELWLDYRSTQEAVLPSQNRFASLPWLITEKTEVTK